ncbi:MAG: FixH family protein [Acidobacteria bacterium]|nr:FixH family protein [Acidobacteriota bacterium]
MHSRTRIIAAVAAILVLVVALLAVGYRSYRGDDHAAHTQVGLSEVWTCPMHPEIREPGPGQCPICGMDLELVTDEPAAPAPAIAGEPADTPRAPIQLDARRRQMLGVRLVTVDTGPIERHIRAVGVVRYDETRLSEVNLKLDGWISKLHVNSTGQAIRRGQPLLDLYSPELVATGQEYLLALSTREAMQTSQISDARAQADRLVESARQRLLLWDLPAESIEQIARTGKSDGTVTLRSPATGIVIEKPVVQGMRAAAGQTLYRIADLSRVWVEAEVFESDAPFVRTGASATVTLDAWPGERLTGRVVYIYPFVEEATRAIRVRLELPNPNQRLKPGMFANVELTASLGSGVTIPTEALLDSGRERVVFVSEGDGYFEPRRVQTGHRVGDRVQIIDGLAAGETIASGAAFFLDSESQLRAAAGGWGAEAAEAPSAVAAEALTIAFRTVPDPPRSGEATFEVDLTDPAGQPITDAQVRVMLYMPAMPSMNMPAMSSEATLVHTGGGTYRGTGRISMSGRWDVTVTVTRNGARLGSRQTTLVAR